MKASDEHFTSENSRIRAVKTSVEASLLQKANVLGVGIGRVTWRGEARLGLVVMVSRKVPLDHLTPADVIPKEIEGVPVRVQAVGELRAVDAQDE